MCTRYYVDLTPELRPYIELANRSPLRSRMVTTLGKPFRESGEMHITDMTAVIATGFKGGKTAFPMVWGYHIDGLNHPVANARVETAKEKRSFSEDWYRHRCIIPSSWYFEWEHIQRPDGKVVTGDKYAIQSKGSNVTCLAGLYHIEEFRGLRYPVFTVLTRAPGEDLAKIHDRMPVVLPKDAADSWILPESNPDRIVEQALTDLVVEKAEARKTKGQER